VARRRVRAGRTLPAFDKRNERVIDDGYLAMRCTDAQGRTLFLEVFGADALLPRLTDGVQAPTTELVALLDTTIIIVPLGAWDARMATDDAFASRVNADRSRQYISLLTRLSSFLSSSSTRRLAGAIAYLCERTGQPAPDGCTIRLSQNRIGTLANLSRPATNRAMQQLRASGFVTLGRMSVTVPDVTHLFEYASCRTPPTEEPNAAA
jgi:CRP-like cAMP-binding protein